MPSFKPILFFQEKMMKNLVNLILDFFLNSFQNGLKDGVSNSSYPLVLVFSVLKKMLMLPISSHLFGHIPDREKDVFR